MNWLSIPYDRGLCSVKVFEQVSGL